MWRLARALPLAPLREFEKKTRGLPRTTETERLVVQRVAQDVFRGALRDYWGGRCAITGCAEPLLLRASHIKPWAVRDRRRATRCLQWSAVGCSYRCRVRHKVLQSRQRGLWMGGHAPLGYVVQDRKLVIDETEGALGRHIFERFPQVGSAIKLVQEVNAAGHRTKRKAFDKGILYKLLHNRTYVGEVEHKGTAYPGEQEAIVDRDTWDKVRAILAENAHRRASRTRATTPALLKGLIFGPDGKTMAPSHTQRRGRLYRFYRTATSLKHSHGECPIRAVPAGEVEAAVIHQIRALLRARGRRAGLAGSAAR
jgi:hypothetical protein